MKIIYISQHFPPEIGAAQGRAHDMANNLTELGHSVTMLTTFPNQEDTMRLYKKEKWNKIDVRRSFRVKDTKASAKRRLANYLSFMVSSTLTGFFMKRPDVVYATSPQLFVGVAGYMLSRFHRTKYVLEVRDLWVDFAEVLSQFNNKHLLKLARKLEIFLYKRADRIITVTYGYKERLISLGIPEGKIEVITNGVDFTQLPKATSNHIRNELHLEGQFVILFAGNIGAAQGLDMLIPVGKKLQEDGVPVTFLLIGEGVEKARLQKEVKESALRNIVFLSSKKKNELQAYYEEADICLVTLKKHPLFSITIPSKLFDCMAVGKPILLGVEGEAKHIVLENGAGVAFEPENPLDLLEKIRFLLTNPALLKEMEQNVERTVMEKYNRKQLAQQLATILETIR